MKTPAHNIKSIYEALNYALNYAREAGVKHMFCSWLKH